jgi:hypothetical protein
MLLQSLVVAMIVIGCAIYAAWTLMPAASRRGIAVALLKLPLPGGMAAFMRRHSVAASGCACDGCDKSVTKTAAPKVHTITLHPRMRK